MKSIENAIGILFLLFFLHTNTHWFYDNNNFHGFTINSLFFSTSVALFNNITNIWGNSDHNRVCYTRAQRFSEWKVDSQWAIEILMNIQKYHTKNSKFFLCSTRIYRVVLFRVCNTLVIGVRQKIYLRIYHCILTSKCVTLTKEYTRRSRER